MRRPRFLEYYRQFEALSPAEDSRRLKARRDEERSRELSVAPVLDLSRPEWHEAPDPDIVNAATFALRRAINHYPPEAGGAAREAIAAHHGIEPGRVVLGHGAAQLLQAAVRRFTAGGAVALPWPSWSALPGLIARTGARPVPVTGPLDPERLAEADGDLRAVVLCSPNDPTGALAGETLLRELASALPPEMPILLDEALVEWAGPGASAVGLTAEIPNLVVFRSFSKAWALAGLRAGYAVAGPEAAGALAELSPGLGVATPALAAIAAALEPGARPIERLGRRVAAARAEREHLLSALEELPLSAAPSAAHFVWLAHDRLDGPGLAHALDEQRIRVAAGTEWGDERHVRVTLRDRAASERLLSALRAI